MTAKTKETRVRVAVVQAGAVPFDTNACVDKAMPLSQPSARDATPAPTQPANSGQTPSPAAQ